MQAGVDLLRSNGTSGLSVAGLYGALGWTGAVVREYDMSVAGRAKLESCSAGLYATHYRAGGWYLDGVAPNHAL